MIQQIKDALHELRIRLDARLMVWHHDGRQRAQKRFFRLINARSADQVARMEREKGLG